MKGKNFMISSESLDKMRGRMEDAIDLINKAISEKRPVWIRHHADCDGYCGAVALERVILKKLHSCHRRESDIFHYFHRYPSRTPYYDYSDAIKDLTNMLSEVNRFEQKKPLIIVIDNGSSREDNLALKRLKVYGIQIVVIDHHLVEEDNNNYIDIHINPLLFGLDPNITAGMLGSEAAHLFDPEEPELELLAALAATGDRSECREADGYASLAEKKGFPPEKLREIAEAVDFELFNVGYMESRYLVDDLLFSDRKKQEETVAILSSEIAKKKGKVISAVETYAEVSSLKGFVLAKLRVDEITQAGEYPLRGKATSIAKDYLGEKLGKPVVMLGHGSNFITFRISRELDGKIFDMNKVCAELEKMYPYALISGGGHAKAGTIRFSSASARAILDSTIEYFRRIK